MKAFPEELNRQQYREEVDSAMILQTSTRSAAGELMATVDCKCSMLCTRQLSMYVYST